FYLLLFNVRINNLMKLQKWNQKIKIISRFRNLKKNGKKNYRPNNMRFCGNQLLKGRTQGNTTCILKKDYILVALVENLCLHPNLSSTGIAGGQVLTKKLLKEKSSKKPTLHTVWFVQ